MNRWLQNELSTNENDDSDSHLDPMLAILQKAKKRVERKWSKNPKNTAKLAEFELIRTLGAGTFGRVMLVRYIIARKKPFCAMKIMAKRKIIRASQLHHAISEKKILHSIKFPFLVNYLHHFKDNANLFLVMDYVQGGDLYTHLKKVGRFEEELAKFYAAQVGLAFEYLHYVGIVYRDLKPENVLIDKFGFIKITDFGFSKKIDDQETQTMCGTPEYYAPELVENLLYSYSVDWWTLGVFIYEISYGRPPFRSADILRLFQLILDNDVEFPIYFSDRTKSIIMSLMKSKRNERIGSAKELKQHLYFEGIDWMVLYKKKLTPPFIPNVSSDDDTQNFEKHHEDRIEEYPEDIYAEEFEDF